ncbi:hypothetical protein BOTBODRAFT_290804 [Botryobasidium botryosum FD-172 SS1]|uniref:Uncharacterized protein n=1 Tax=Botryobasidium botryosum (strain FD-172 SS1) TaxID=930990 RepID=A0A067MI04_BOTB1|nr:hypothetical protein BOTBODRAFT_290804 [Botryobasidium botryosum FD-172 SS1]
MQLDSRILNFFNSLHRMAVASRSPPPSAEDAAYLAAGKKRLLSCIRTTHEICSLLAAINTSSPAPAWDRRIDITRTLNPSPMSGGATVSLYLTRALWGWVWPSRCAQRDVHACCCNPGLYPQTHTVPWRLQCTTMRPTMSSPPDTDTSAPSMSAAHAS